MQNASNERPPGDQVRGPSLRQRAEAIAERLDLWARAGGRAIPEPVLFKLERLIELSMRAAICTVERARAAKLKRSAGAPADAPLPGPLPPVPPPASSGARSASEAGRPSKQLPGSVTTKS